MVVSIVMGVPSWLVDFMENPNLKFHMCLDLKYIWSIKLDIPWFDRLIWTINSPHAFSNFGGGIHLSFFQGIHKICHWMICRPVFWKCYIPKKNPLEKNMVHFMFDVLLHELVSRWSCDSQISVQKMLMFAISRKILTLPGFSYESLQGGATDFAKLVNITPITMAYGRCN